MGRRHEQTFSQREVLHETMLYMISHQGNANQNHSEISRPLEWLLKTNWKKTRAGEDVQKRAILCGAGRNVNWWSQHGKHYGGSSKN